MSNSPIWVRPRPNSPKCPECKRHPFEKSDCDNKIHIPVTLDDWQKALLKRYRDSFLKWPTPTAGVCAYGHPGCLWVEA